MQPGNHAVDGRRNMGMKRIALALFALLMLAGGRAIAEDHPQTADWPFVGGDIGGQRYSSLGEITKDNVGKLKVAWTYHTGDFSLGGPDKSTTAFEAAPIEVAGTLYLCSPNDHVIA